uniref:Uncharacterized protein n=1 Tax=Strigops habroptila TaxID=2489341 RepID=A0A672VAD3_STRHB
MLFQPHTDVTAPEHPVTRGKNNSNGFYQSFTHQGRGDILAGPSLHTDVAGGNVTSTIPRRSARLKVLHASTVIAPLYLPGDVVPGSLVRTGNSEKIKASASRAFILPSRDREAPCLLTFWLPKPS